MRFFGRLYCARRKIDSFLAVLHNCSVELVLNIRVGSTNLPAETAQMSCGTGSTLPVGSLVCVRQNKQGRNPPTFPQQLITAMTSPEKTVVLDIVGLTQSLISTDHTPFLHGYLSQPDVLSRDVEPSFPALTCPAQSTYLTGAGPASHGVTANVSGGCVDWTCRNFAAFSCIFVECCTAISSSMFVLMKSAQNISTFRGVVRQIQESPTDCPR